MYFLKSLFFFSVAFWIPLVSVVLVKTFSFLLSFFDGTWELKYSQCLDNFQKGPFHVM